MSRIKNSRKGNGKNTFVIYLCLSAIWFLSSAVNFYQGYKPVGVVYICLGVLFLLIGLRNR